MLVCALFVCLFVSGQMLEAGRAVTEPGSCRGVIELPHTPRTAEHMRPSTLGHCIDGAVSKRVSEWVSESWVLVINSLSPSVSPSRHSLNAESLLFWSIPHVCMFSDPCWALTCSRFLSSGWTLMLPGICNGSRVVLWMGFQLLSTCLLWMKLSGTAGFDTQFELYFQLFLFICLFVSHQPRALRVSSRMSRAECLETDWISCYLISKSKALFSCRKVTKTTILGIQL